VNETTQENQPRAGQELSPRALELLDAAQRLTQERGFNAFSYADLAEQVGIRTASIHYHFKSKASLGRALMERYTARLEESLAEMDAQESSSRSRLERFIDIHRATQAEGLICLCGSMASDAVTLDDELSEAIDAYLAEAESWVCRTIEQGVVEGEFSPTAEVGDLAASLVSGLQGALIVCRARATGSVLDSVQRSFFTSLGG